MLGCCSGVGVGPRVDLALRRPGSRGQLYAWGRRHGELWPPCGELAWACSGERLGLMVASVKKLLVLLESECGDVERLLAHLQLAETEVSELLSEQAGPGRTVSVSWLLPGPVQDLHNHSRTLVFTALKH